jgi:HK97 family phage major capsid protein
MSDRLTAKALREQNAEIAKEIRRLADLSNDEKRDFTAEEKAKWEAVNADYNATASRIELLERAEKIEADLASHRSAAPGREDITREQRTQERKVSLDDGKSITAEHRALAMQGWFRRQSDLEPTLEQKDAAKRLGVRLASRRFDINLRKRPMSTRELRAMSVGDPAAGGSTVPDEFVNQFERAMLSFSGVRQAADILRTTSGAPLTWPTTDDTSNEGTIVGEGQDPGDQDIATGAVTWNAYKFSSKVIKINHELLEDSAFNLASVIGSMAGERIGRYQNRKFTVGTGAAEPNGIVTASAAGKTATSATAVSFDDIMDFVHSINPAYRGPGCGLMFHDNLLLAIRKLKDGNGTYLWQQGVSAGEPDRILGFPYYINQHMASTIESGAKTMLFGQLDKYKIREVRGLRLMRMRELYAETDQEGFVAFFRADGNLLDAGVDPVKHMVH